MKFFSFHVGQPDLWRRIIAHDNHALRGPLTWITLGLVALIGEVDFLLGFEVSMLVFYFVPVALAVAARGWKFGVLIAVACVASWIAGDLAAGAHYGSRVVPFWNAIIALLTYLVLIWLLAGLLTLQHELEARVERRTAALANEVAERERLERVVLEISERERRSIGHDLHDGLGQHLTGTALTGQLLAEKLQERAAVEAPDARKLVTLIKAAISQTRQMAKGLLLADIDAEGLADALQEFCATIGLQYRIECRFDGGNRVALTENGVASHLYRIAQEAVRNAIRHGQAKHVTVRLGREDQKLTLRVSDDGVGLPAPAERGAGLGLRIMEHRARLIGADFSIETPPEGGTLVTCRLALPST